MAYYGGKIPGGSNSGFEFPLLRAWTLLVGLAYYITVFNYGYPYLAIFYVIQVFLSWLATDWGYARVLLTKGIIYLGIVLTFHWLLLMPFDLEQYLLYLLAIIFSTLFFIISYLIAEMSFDEGPEATVD
ncbi:hypothetical protein [Kangiella sp. HZ709]|uniref:hypothetical protein n=1 Tax=Kangiella sp. HZ709 TaxID=2666328 RepID=UPI0012AFBD05|nr:hypothetical protein [Kangiella sp. HZ709]MRX27930.1 hypothetical protein [Kangiella sp. HZ709]